MTKPHPMILAGLGVVTMLCTLWVQVRAVQDRSSADGEFRGWLKQVIEGQKATDAQHDLALKEHAKELQEHDRTIIALESRLHGISTKLGQLPGKVTSKLDNSDTNKP